MRKIIVKRSSHLTWFCLVPFVFFFSCSAVPEVRETVPEPVISKTKTQDQGLSKIEEPESDESEIAAPLVEAEALDEVPAEKAAQTVSAASYTEERFLAPKRLVKPQVPEYIMGKGLTPAKDMASFLLGTNPAIEKEFIENLALIYTEEASVEGVNHDTAFAQMCLETGFLRFGGLVTPDMNNFCGLGATGPGFPGVEFPNPRMGVRAHIQHLKAYATDAPLKQLLVDPRYHLVNSGSSPAIQGLSGTWAVDRDYASKITSILERLYTFAWE
jgi:hypothetical protein